MGRKDDSMKNVDYGWFTVATQKTREPMTTSEKYTVLVGWLSIAAGIAWVLWRL